MATYVSVSAVIPLPLETVWNQLRDFTFPARLLASTIASVELEDDSASDGRKRDGASVGIVRKVTWKSGEWRKHRLLELSDQFNILRWELTDANPAHEVTAAVSKIRCSRISELNHTLVEWTGEYSSDASAQFIFYERKSFEENLVEIRCKLTGVELPTLYHIPEAPSVRVIWICAELGVPIRIKEAKPSASPSLRKSSQSISTVKGGLVTSFVEGDVTILESGAIVFYLLEKYDHLHKLSPPLGTPERAKFLKFFFHLSNTVDNIVFDAYKHAYVLRDEQDGVDHEGAVLSSQEIFDQFVVSEFQDQFKNHSYICGDNFSACDIMAGWTLFVANLLGWLDSYPFLKQYLDRISKRGAAQKAFSQ
eukprot:TRINITY_DN2372_c0_g1_i1.p1 TRINITY_DN2372_c0_g1~~TRINITY_DN2372_c0_g1_i1.p1  ORF type:complete len:365 (-),score=72.12 TRINITY_DN2372_c0_g1_i1:52-1146(-)